MDSRLLLGVLVFLSREWSTFLTPLLSLPIELNPLYWKVFQAISSNSQESMLSNAGVGTILREAKRNNDDWTMSAMIDTEKKVRSREHVLRCESRP